MNIPRQSIIHCHTQEFCVGAIFKNNWFWASHLFSVVNAMCLMQK